jgi:hypothetical protein
VRTYYQAATCGSFLTTIDTINIASIPNPGTIDSSRCAPGIVTVLATGTNQVVWFDSLSGGTVLDTGVVLTRYVTTSGSFYASSIGNVSTSKTDTSTFAQTLTTGGNMFTITAINNLLITGFDVHGVGGTNTWMIYYRKDNFLNVPGSNTSSAGWILLDSVSNVISPGVGLPTSIPANFSVLVPAGQTYSFYVMTTSGNGVYSN